MTRLGGFGVPGMGASDSISRRELLWGGDDSYHAALWKGGVISGAARDAGNTPTSVLRAGLVLGQLTSGGEHAEFNYDLADGSQNVAGVLDHELRMTDFDANNADRVTRILVRGPVKASMLLIEGSAFVGHAAEYVARRQMHNSGFIFDDDPMGYLTGLVPRVEHVTGTTDSLTASQNGMTLFYNNAASVTVTLPAIQAGLSFELRRVGDEEFVITSAEGDNIVFGNDLSGDSLTLTTAAEHLGAGVRVRSVLVSTTLKWLIELVPVPLGVGLDAWTYSIAT
jgi:hypothetical protein